MICKISDLFDVNYGNSFALNTLIEDKNGVNFISRIGKNNGCSSKVKEIENIKPFNSGLITVAVNGDNVLDSFVQPRPFYTGYHVMVLTPKVGMTLEEKIFYCLCLRQNKFRYSYGRQANITLKDIPIPSKERIPEWVKKISPPNLDEINDPVQPKRTSLSDREFRYFLYSDLFDIKKGKRIVASKISERGNCPLVSAIDKNNGIRDMLDVEPNHEGNTITVNYNGSVGEAFYQSDPYWATDDVNVLYPKFKLNVFIAMFLITLVKKEKYRFNYGRKWHKERMENTKIKLPVNTDGEPDWKFMEDYIKSLPYSKGLEHVDKKFERSPRRQHTQKTFIDY